MKVNLVAQVSDSHVDLSQAKSQRQILLSVGTSLESQEDPIPLNLCCMIECSHAMAGEPWERAKEAVLSLAGRLRPCDRLSIVAFNQHSTVILPQQLGRDFQAIQQKLDHLQAHGDSGIDEALKLSINTLIKTGEGSTSHIFVLAARATNRNVNKRCLTLAQLAIAYQIKVSILGFGQHWNVEMLEKIAANTHGSLTHIESAEQILVEFWRLLHEIQSTSATNAALLLTLGPASHLAQIKPAAQVMPETKELYCTGEGDAVVLSCGDLNTLQPLQIIVNVYVDQPPPGQSTLLNAQVRYDLPQQKVRQQLSARLALPVIAQKEYQPQFNPKIRPAIITLAKYRQAQLANEKLQNGDRNGAVDLLQTAAMSALQAGDLEAATILQENAIRLHETGGFAAGGVQKMCIAAKRWLQVDTISDQ